MTWTITIEDNKLVIYYDEDIEREKYDLDTISLMMCKIISESDAIYIKVPCTMENAKKIQSFYNKICNTEIQYIVSVVELSDDEIKNNSKIYKWLENTINCRFEYKYDKTSTTSLDKMLNAINYLDEQVRFIKQYDFSPLESLLYIYDIVRDKEYVDVPNGENRGLSRDLTKIIDSPYIVCDGYTQLFSAIANKAGIYTEDLLWGSAVNVRKGHASNLCYINDSKYDIHGVFETDATGGRKRGNNNFLYDYSSFYNYLTRAIEKKKSENLVILKESNNFYKWLIKKYQKFISSDNNDNDALVLLIWLKNYMSVVGLDTFEIEKLKNKTYSNNETEFIEDLQLQIKEQGIFDSITKCKINIYSFLGALYNVRKVEHSIDKDKYPFSYKEFYKIYANTFKEKASRDLFQMMLISGAFGDYEEISKYESYEEFFDMEARRMELNSGLRQEEKRRIKQK